MWRIYARYGNGWFPLRDWYLTKQDADDSISRIGGARRMEAREEKQPRVK